MWQGRRDLLQGGIMSQTISQVLLHIVFSTKSRQSWLDGKISEELYKYIGSICQTKKSHVIAIGGVADHIHILVTLARDVSISDLIRTIKSNSSRWLKSKGLVDFSWQSGYGVFSVSHSLQETVGHYVLNQKEHHKFFDFKNEFLRLLQRHQTPYDEKYLWD